MPLFLWVLSACTATIQVYGAPEGSTVYLTKQPPTPNAKPAISVGQGKLPNASFTTNYFLWDSYYLWIAQEGYETQVVKVPNEAKVGPIVGTLFCLFPVIWAAGPTQNPINVELERD